MKNLFLIATFIVSGLSISKASENINPLDGIVISINPEKSAVKSADSVTFYGTIKLIEKAKIKNNEDESNKGDNNDQKSKKIGNLLDYFKTRGFEIVGSFPNETMDVSSKLVLTGKSETEIGFTFSATNISAADLNQFSVKVFNDTKQKDLLSRLSQIQAKLQKRILALESLKKNSRKEAWSDKALSYLNNKSSELSKIIAQITLSINSSQNLLAENKYALQVDNVIASSSQISTIMNKYKFLLTSDVGSVIEGLTTKIHGSITNLSKNGDDENQSEKEKDDEDSKKIKLKIADFIFNDKYLNTSSVELKSGQTVSFDYQTDRLLPSDKNIFSIALYNSKKNIRKNRIGYLSFKIPVIADQVPPFWLGDSAPSNSPLTVSSIIQSYQTLIPVNLSVADSFGRIDEKSFSAKLSGILLDNSTFNQDLSIKFSKSSLLDGASYNFLAELNPLAEGVYNFQASVKDYAKNSALADPYKFSFRIDRTPPTVTVALNDGILTNSSVYSVPVTVNDLSPTVTKIFVNDKLQGTSSEKSINFGIFLDVEGANSIKVTSTDSAGNSTNSTAKVITKDTLPPVLSNLSPADGARISTFLFNVRGISNKVLASITLNGKPLTISSDGKSFSGTYFSSISGANSLVWVANDLVGNTRTITTTVYLVNPLLTPSLVTIYPAADNMHFKVVGLSGAARPGAGISISAGSLSFNRGTDIAKADGTFSVTLNKFTTVNVKATDSNLNEEASFDLNFNIPTSISGIIQDTNAVPLPGATVRILGSSAMGVADATGVFIIKDAPLGDQTISIDGSTILPTTVGALRKFSVTNLSVAVSAGRVNAFSRPIYLTATMLDGSGTTVAAAAPATVTDSNAPGVSISIPANGAIFPDGTTAGHISVTNIPVSRTVLPPPSGFMPDQVLALEPSGLRFSQRVDVSFPNDNALKEGTEVFVLSLNSISGQWEIDGVGKVDIGGQQITTKPGQGISHFSEVYVVPTIPLIESVQDSNLVGIDSSKGASETSVSLPSFQSLGLSVTPALRYKSAWAKPTAFVSNIFDIPKYEIRFSQSASTHTIDSLQGPPMFCFFGYCSTSQYLQEVYTREDYTTTSSYVPDEISAQSWVGINSTDDQTYQIINQPISSTDLPGANITNSLKTNKWTLVNNAEGTKIPNLSQISFAIPLIKDDQSYLKTGIYPSFTRFQVKLKHLTITTLLVDQFVKINGEISDPNTFTRITRDVKSSQLSQILPKDINRNILVQNKINSPVGRGWNFDPTRKLLNTQGSKILMEDGSGEVSTYTSAIPIETLFNANGTDVNLQYGAGLGSWPNLYVSSYGADKIGRVLKIDGNNPSTSKQISQLENLSGTTGFDKIDDCFTDTINSSIKLYKFDFTQKPGISNFVQFPNGRLIASNTTTHSVIDVTGANSFTLGGYRKMALNGTSFDLNTDGAGFDQRKQSLCSTLNLDCSVPVNLNQTQSCNTPLTIHDQSGVLASSSTNIPSSNLEATNFSNGAVNMSGSFGTTDFMRVGFNNPSGMVISSDGKLVIADTGSNVVFKINTETGTIKILAGNYSATDSGDGLQASPFVTYDIVKIDPIRNLRDLILHDLFKKAFATLTNLITNYGGAGIYHPKGLAYDTLGRGSSAI